ncbi:hypothetical protein Tco_1496598 [Tanacetum coccineum]
MEAHIALIQPTQVNKITSSCEIYSGPHDTQYCMEDPEQAFVKYASSRTNKAGVLAHAPIYNAMLDKYVESLELGKHGSTFVQGEVSSKMGDPELFTLPCRFGDSKPFNTLIDLGSCGNIIPLYLFKKLNIELLEETDHIFGLADGTKSYPAKIAVGEGIIRSIFGVKGVNLSEEEAPYWTTLGKRESYKPRPSSDGVGARTPYYARKDFLDSHLPEECEIARDAGINPFKDVLYLEEWRNF